MNVVDAFLGHTARGKPSLLAAMLGSSMTALALAALLSIPTSGRRDQAALPGSLVALVGAQRALILELLNRPMTAGDLAGALAAGPSNVTYHVAALERAGLLARARDGRHVLIRRTVRGTKLVGLYRAS